MSEAEKKVKERYPDAELFMRGASGRWVVLCEQIMEPIGDEEATRDAAWQSALERMEKQ